MFTFLCLRLHGDDIAVYLNSIHIIGKKQLTVEVCVTGELLRFAKILKDVSACVSPNLAVGSIASGGKGYKL